SPKQYSQFSCFKLASSSEKVTFSLLRSCELQLPVAAASGVLPCFSGLDSSEQLPDKAQQSG
ncbi:hypothetical protein ACO1ZZ_17125, partial [Klebsiella quasipneumoniae]